MRLDKSGTLPPKTAQGYSLRKSVKRYLTSKRSGTGGVARERERLLAAQATKIELATRVREGELIGKKYVEESAFRAYRQTRDCLLNIPDRLAGPVTAETDQQKNHKLMRDEILAALTSLSEGRLDDMPKPKKEALHGNAHHADGAREHTAEPEAAPGQVGATVGRPDRCRPRSRACPSPVKTGNGRAALRAG
jgi:hypothetical protein